jgi:endonuclease/exonuclease/phosphatase family metal-dependent hydrolase
MAHLCSTPLVEYEDAICSVEQGSFIISSPSSSLPSKLLTVSFNINYNGSGGEGDPYKQNGLPGIIALLRKLDADFIFLSEVERGCSRSGGNNGAAALAAELNYAYAYAVEFVDLNSSYGGNECTTGNAVLSRYNLTDAAQTRFRDQCCMYGGRAGARSAITATANVNGNYRVALTSAHLESGNEEEFLPAVFVRGDQASELAIVTSEHAEEHDCQQSIIGGDFNSPFRSLDPVLLALEYKGYTDAHSTLPDSERRTLEGTGETNTVHDQVGIGTLDYIFVKPASAIVTQESGICHSPDLCWGWSDHTSIWSVTSTTGTDSERYDGATLASLNNPSSDALPYKANWLWLNCAVICPFILVHALVAIRRHSKRHSLTRSSSIAKRQQQLSHVLPELKYTPAFVSLSVALCCFGVLAVVVSALGYAAHREFQTWNLFLALIYLTPQIRNGRNDDFLGKHVLGVAAQCSASGWLLFVAVTLPTSAAGKGVTKWPTVLLDVGLYVTLPLWLLYVLFRTKVKLSWSTCHISLASSVWLLAFLSIDFLANTGTNPFTAWALFNSSVLLSPPFWLVLFTFNWLVGLAVGLIVGGKARSDVWRCRDRGSNLL